MGTESSVSRARVLLAVLLLLAQPVNTYPSPSHHRVQEQLQAPRYLSFERGKECKGDVRIRTATDVKKYQDCTSIIPLSRAISA